jgi:hypothetical protein
MSAWLRGVQYAEKVGEVEVFKRAKFYLYISEDFLTGVRDYLEYEKTVLQPIKEERQNG